MFAKKFSSIILIVIAGVIFILGGISVMADDGESLLVYSGAGLRKPMDEIGELFEEKYGVKIEYTYAGSAHNLSQLKLIKKGDVYIPGAMSYYESAAEDGLVEMKKDVVLHIPVIVVPEGNPADIHSLTDMGREGVEVILGDEKAAAIGRISQKIFEKNNLSELINKNVIAKAATVNELVVYLSIGQGEASIIWEDNVYGVDDVEIIRIDQDKNIIKTIPACALAFSEKKELAKKFVEFVASETGRNIYQKHGFKPIK